MVSREYEKLQRSQQKRTCQGNIEHVSQVEGT